jgi:hypothetical protein
MRNIESKRGPHSLAPLSQQIVSHRAVKTRVEFKSSRSHQEVPQPCSDLISSLAESIGVQASSLKPLIELQPGLIGMTSSPLTSQAARQAENVQKQVVSRIRYLSQCLSVPIELIIKMTAKQPGVLSAPPSMILQRADEIERRLSIPQGSILHLLCYQPEFLEMSSDRLVSRTLQLASTIGDTSPLDVLKALSRLNPPSSLLSLMGKRNSSISLRIAQLNELLGAPGMAGPVPMVDDPTLNEDGSQRFQPLLMRNPLPGAIESLQVSTYEMKVIRKNLRRAAHKIEAGAKAAGHLSSGASTPLAVALSLKCPDLFLIPMDEISSSHQTLLSLLQVPSHRLSAILLRCPTLLSLPTSQIHDSWACLSKELNVEPSLLKRRVLQQPRILALTSEEIMSRMRELQETLGWTRAATKRAVRNQCQLLGMSTEAIRSKVEWLARELDLRDEGTPPGYAASSRVVLKQPALLTLSISTLSRNLNGLRSALHLHLLQSTTLSSLRHLVECEPTLLTQPPTTLMHKAAQISAILNLPSPNPLILKHPSLLSIPTSNLVYIIDELQMIHGCSQTEAIDLFKGNPSELLRK